MVGCVFFALSPSFVFCIFSVHAGNLSSGTGCRIISPVRTPYPMIYPWVLVRSLLHSALSDSSSSSIAHASSSCMSSSLGANRISSFATRMVPRVYIFSLPFCAVPLGYIWLPPILFALGDCCLCSTPRYRLLVESLT